MRAPLFATAAVTVSAAVVSGVAATGVQAQSDTVVRDGLYTESQAARGAVKYAEACASCHGNELEGAQFAPPLVGDPFKMRWAGGSAGDLFIVIKATMPADHPDTLSGKDCADLIAFLFKTNGLPAGQSELGDELPALQSIVIPK